MAIEFAAEAVPMYKLALHIAQMVLTFVAWILEIVVFNKDRITGNTGWVFGLMFLTIPAWIYLCMAPRWPRTRKFAEPRAMAVVDGLFVILWLSAFAAQAAYNTAGCNDACSVSKTVVGLSFFVMLFFIGSTVISIYTVKYWQWNNGRLPGYPENDNKKMRLADNEIDPHKNAFSTDMSDVDGQYSAVHNADDRDDDHTTTYGNGGAYSTMGSRYGNTDIDGGYGSAIGGGAARSDLSYGGAGQTELSGYTDDTEYRPHTAATSSVGGHPYNPPSAVDAYDDDRPAQFPSAPYNRT